MRLKDKFISALLNIFIGVGWAFVFVGAVSAFMRNIHYPGLLYALSAALLWSLPGLLFVLLSEYMLSGFARLEEARKQTEILEKMLEESRKRD